MEYLTILIAPACRRVCSNNQIWRFPSLPDRLKNHPQVAAQTGMDLSARFAGREHHLTHQRRDRLGGIPVGLWFIEPLRQLGGLGAITVATLGCTSGRSAGASARLVPVDTAGRLAVTYNTTNPHPWLERLERACEIDRLACGLAPNSEGRLLQEEAPSAHPGRQFLHRKSRIFFGRITAEPARFTPECGRFVRISRNHPACEWQRLRRARFPRRRQGRLYRRSLSVL